jgi:hypothetical protein
MSIANTPLADLKYFFTYLQIITAIAGSLYYYKYKDTYLKYFLFLLWYIVLNDIFAELYRVKVSTLDFFFYNSSQLVSFSLYFLLFKNAVKNINRERTILILLLLYYCFYIGCLFFENFFTNYFLSAFIFGGILIIISILIYLFEILKTDQIIQINKMLLLWISIGLLFFLIPNIPFGIIRNFYKDSPTIPNIYVVYFMLLFFYNIILITGFISSSKTQRDFV